MDLKEEIRDYFYNKLSTIEEDIANVIAIAEKHQAFKLQQTGVSGSVLSGVELVKKCAEFVVETQNGSISSLQRQFNLNYNKAGRIMDVLQEIKIVGEFTGLKKREVFIENLEDLKIKLEEINFKNCRFV